MRRKDRNNSTLFVVGIFRTIFIYVVGGILVVGGIVALCLSTQSNNVFGLGVLMISFGVLSVAVVLLCSIKVETFAKLDSKQIRIVTLFNKTKKEEQWEDLKDVTYQELVNPESRSPGDRFIILSFSLAEISNEDSIKKIEQEPRVMMILDTPKHKKILKEFVPQKFKDCFVEEMSFKTVYIEGNFIRAHLSLYLALTILALGVIFIVPMLRAQGLIGETLMIILITLLFLLAILISFIGVNEPVRLEVNREKVVKRKAMGRRSAVGESSWTDLKAVFIMRSRLKREYLVMNFTGEEIGGKTIGELIKTPQVMVAKLTRRNRRIIKQFLPEKFKDCI